MLKQYYVTYIIYSFFVFFFFCSFEDNEYNVTSFRRRIVFFFSLTRKLSYNKRRNELQAERERKTTLFCAFFFFFISRTSLIRICRLNFTVEQLFLSFSNYSKNVSKAAYVLLNPYKLFKLLFQNFASSFVHITAKKLYYTDFGIAFERDCSSLYQRSLYILY